MGMRDLFHKTASDLLLVPQVVTADATPANGASLLESDSVNLLAIIGTFAGLDGSNYIEIIAEDSPDDSTWTAITDQKKLLGLTLGALGVVATIDAPAEDDVIVDGGYVGTEDYARLRIAVTGTVSIPATIIAIRGNLNRSPEV